MKIFKSAALLCAISFNPSQASDCGNPYGISQENTRNNRCIRVITEIPCGVVDSGISHHGICEHPCANVLKKSGPQALIENLLIELIKNLKVASAASDPENEPTFGIGGGPGVAEVNAARNAAERAKTAELAAAKAKEAANLAENLYQKDMTNLRNRTNADFKARTAEIAAAEVAKLNGEATKSVAAANEAAAKAIAAGHPVFVYEEPAPSSIAGKMITTMRNHFRTLAPDAKIKYLKVAVNAAMSSPKVVNPLRTNVDIANDVLNALIEAGAPPEYIRDNWSAIWVEPWSNPWSKLPRSTAIKDIAFAALPWERL